MLKITSAQINPTIGDIAGNIARMSQAAAKADADGAHMIVFPELSLTAYYPGDLLDDALFVDRVKSGLSALRQASRATPQLHWVIGAPVPREGVGKSFHNALWVLRDGEILLQYAKQLLPTYGIFDERRHFEPGPDVAKVLRIGQATVGFIICEDGWNADGRDYEVDPLERLRSSSPDLVVSINASPSNIGKREQRHNLFQAAADRYAFPILYVNQVGGHDSLVYDGCSFAVEPGARHPVFEAERFVEDFALLAFDRDQRAFVDSGGAPLRQRTRQSVDKNLSTMSFFHEQIVLGIRDYARRCGFTQAVVGCSGGIDSAVVVALAVDALGARNVRALTMPSRYSSPGSVSDSATLCANLGVRLDECAIEGMVDAVHAGMLASTLAEPPSGLAAENLQARLRGTLLMTFSNLHGHLLLTTGNKSEISVGYCTLYGDTNGGLGPIGDLYKTEVFRLAQHINRRAGRPLIPESIIDKPPSAELAPDQKDTESLPPYDVLDNILKVLVEGERLADWEYADAAGAVSRLCESLEGRQAVEKIKKLIARNEYKRRQSPPILRVRSRAFGSGRQLPIAAVHY